MQFQCSACGICCFIKRFDSMEIPEPYKSVWAKFPYKQQENGFCEKFDMTEMKCTCYKDRPEACNVEQLWKDHYKPFMSKKSFFKVQYIACNELMDLADAPKHLRINEALLK